MFKRIRVVYANICEKGEAMQTISLNEVQQTAALLNLTNYSDEPVIVLDGSKECMVALSPRVLDRLLFDLNLLNCSDRHVSWC